MAKPNISKSDRDDMKEHANAAWWTRPVCWSGIRNDLEAKALNAEAIARTATTNDYWARAAINFSRLAKLANAMVTFEALELAK